MAEVIQGIIDNSLYEIQKPWEEIGVKFKGKKVIKVPEDVSFALEALENAEKILQPEYVVKEKTIKPSSNYFGLKLSPASIGGVEVFIWFEPQELDRGPGYIAHFNFFLQKNKFKSTAPIALQLDEDQLNKERYVKSVIWNATSSDKPYADNRLSHYTTYLKNQLMTASTLKKK
jgi:hypothetical protein